MQEASFKYYCYLCQKYLSSPHKKYSCIMCDSNAIQFLQESQSNNSPSSFAIYELKNNKTHQQSLGTLDNGIAPRGSSLTRTVVSIVSTATMASLEDFAQGSYLGNILRQFLNDGNRLTAATQQQIGRLQKVQEVKQCSICQTIEEQMEQQCEQTIEQRKGYKLKCSHTFHTECIRPWFSKANTCPVCRKGIHE